MSKRVAVVGSDQAEVDRARTVLEDAGFVVDTVVEPEQREPQPDQGGHAIDREELQRRATLGTLVAGATHEINNLLTPLQAALRGALRAVAQLPEEPEPRRLQAQLEDALASCDRLVVLGTDLLGFARADRDGACATDVHNVIEEALHVVAAELRGTIRVVRDYVHGLPRVRVEPQKMAQVFVNLLLNAVHALGSPGVEGRIQIRSSLDGRHVRIDVEDDGVGIAPEVMPHVFEPFYSTKDGGGTGLGLPVSREIVVGYGGDILVHSEQGRGSCFTVLLPAVD